MTGSIHHLLHKQAVGCALLGSAKFLVPRSCLTNPVSLAIPAVRLCQCLAPPPLCACAHEGTKRSVSLYTFRRPCHRGGRAYSAEHTGQRAASNPWPPQAASSPLPTPALSVSASEPLNKVVVARGREPARGDVRRLGQRERAARGSAAAGPSRAG